MRRFFLLWALAACARSEAAPPATHVLMINGGGSPDENFASHGEHLRQMALLVVDGAIPRERITILSSDGADPTPDLAVRASDPDGVWLLTGTEEGERLRPPLTLENSTVPGFTLQPATRASLERWFASARTRLRPGDTLLLYVTDHGTAGRDPLDNRITLWGKKESISVRQLRTLIDRLDRKVRVVTVMSQCFSGGFARLYQAHNTCGFFSSTADRPAYGCYPETAGRDRIGHSFEFMQALSRSGRLADAHVEVLSSDDTPDTPLRTSDVFLSDLLARAARSAGQDESAFIDALLHEAWKDRASWESEIRLLDRIAQAFGLASPRLLLELDRQGKVLPGLLRQLQTHREDWEQALAFAAQGNLRRFLAAEPDWTAKVGTPAVAADVLKALSAFARTDAIRWKRLETFQERTDSADAATYRMEVRLAALLRLRTVLTTIAGRVFVTSRATPADRAAYEALVRCEDMTLPLPRATESPAPPERFPTLQQDLNIVQAVIPGWMGISFGALSPKRREQMKLGEGAAIVQGVLPDSPAHEAGFHPGDVVLGPPERLFSEQSEIKGWTMTLAIKKPQPVAVLRAGKPLVLTLVPRERPVELPRLAGPPAVSSNAPPVIGNPYRGKPADLVSANGPFVLFFWGTWCGPCKEALPELMAFARARNLPIVAVTDEGRTDLDTFFARWKTPFPDNVLSDEDRLTFLGYGVSGTPTFVMVDATRKVRAYAVGYNRTRGLSADFAGVGWRWVGR